MTYQQRLSIPVDAKIWAYDGSALPDWLTPHVASPVAFNGTFLVKTPMGKARVHLGNFVIEHRTGIWVRTVEELADFLKSLEAEAAAPITNVGPGKARQFGNRAAPRKRDGERKIAYRRPLGSMPRIEWVHTASLSVDATYQRSTDNEASKRLISSIAANFDWRLCGPLVVSRRPDGSRVIIDGQHRWSAASRRGDILQLPCCLFTYDSPEEEARMFIVANRARKPMNRLDDFHAALAAADEDALEIQQLVTDAGLSIARSTSSAAWRPGQLAFTAAIASALRKQGAPVVSAALTSIAEAFPGEHLTHGGSIFAGLVSVFANPPQGFDPDRILDALKTFDVRGWGDFVKGVKGGETRGTVMRTAILEAMTCELAVAAE